jgi:hypothetical protein
MTGTIAAAARCHLDSGTLTETLLPFDAFVKTGP